MRWNPTPHFRAFLGAAALVALLTMGMVRGARAAEPDPGCMQVMAPEAGVVYDRHRAGVPDALNRVLVRTDPDYRGAGRWVLLRFLDALEAGQWFDREAAITAILGALCSIPNPPEVPGLYRPPYSRPQNT